MPSKKTWIWIIVSVVGLCLLGMVAVAGVAVFFVRQHVQVEASSNVNSEKAFETARKAFKDPRPLVELDSLGRARTLRKLSELPTSPNKPTEMVVMAWDENKERLVHVSMPFWLLRLGRGKVDLANGDRNFDFERLNVDIEELERVGPQLVIDTRSPSGARVLVWTQ